VNRRTGMAFTGKTTWNLKLGRGTYVARSDPSHSKRTLRVR
jgi:hypothetical protein